MTRNAHRRDQRGAPTQYRIEHQAKGKRQIGIEQPQSFSFGQYFNRLRKLGEIKRLSMLFN